MVYYLLDPKNPTKSCTSRGLNLGVHFKNTCETAQAIKSIHPKSHQVSEGCHSTEAVCAILPLHWWSLLVAPKRVLNILTAHAQKCRE